MGKLKIQFDSDKPIQVSEIEDNAPFNITLLKSKQTIGKGIEFSQESACFIFTDGKKKFKIFIE